MPTACEAYVKGLLRTGNGYPQYVPEPNASLPEECKGRGILEGDVGILNQDGTWDYLFNVTKPSDLRINAGRTPPDFEWTPIDEEYDISTTPNFFKSGEHVASTSMTTTTLVADISTADNSGASSVGARLQYKCSVSKGAMADFPEGCDRRDLLNKEKLRNLALRCGTSWYKHANGERFGRNAPNGSLYVVTGCDKTNTWRLASWSCGCKRGDISLTVTPTPSEGGASFSYSHENCTSATTGIRTSPSHTSGKNQCMFLRGFKVALREDPMSRVLGSVVLTSVLGAKSNQIIPRWNGANIPRPYVDNRRWPSGSPTESGISGSNSDSLSRTCPLPSDNSDSSEPEDESDDISTGNSSVEMLPRSKPYHPSNLVISWLLDTVPDAQVVLVDDEVWMSVLEQDESEMPDDTELLRRISEVYEPRIESGGAFLAPSDGGDTSSGMRSCVQAAKNILAGSVDNPLRCGEVGDLDAPLCLQNAIVRSSSVGLLPFPDESSRFGPTLPRLPFAATHMRNSKTSHKMLTLLGRHKSVLRELFGDRRLEIITSVLHRDIDVLLYHLKEPLGASTHRAIASEPIPWRRTRTLLLTIDEQSGDTRLARAFRTYVLENEGVQHILTRDAQKEAVKRRRSALSPNSIQAQGSAQPSSTTGFRTSHNNPIPSVRDHPTENALLPSNGDPTAEIWSIDGLLDRLITSDGMDKDLMFRETFLATYPAFSSCSDVFKGLSRRFYKIYSKQENTKLRVDGCFNVISVMHEWVASPYTVVDAHVLPRMKIFANDVDTPQTLQKHAQKLRGCIDTRLSVRDPTMTHSSYSPIVHPLFHYTVKEIAAALTELERQMYLLIRPADYIFHLRKSPISDHVESASRLNLKIRFWVMRTLLSYEQVLQRSRGFKLFLKTAEECRTMGNYSSAASIIWALNSRPIKTLSETVNALDPKYQKRLHDLTETFMSASRYRDSLRYPCLPCLGHLLSDLDTAVLKCVHEVANGQTGVNLIACLALEAHLRDIIKFKPSSVCPTPSPNASAFLRSQLENVEVDKHVMEEFHRTSKKLRGEEIEWCKSGNSASQMQRFNVAVKNRVQRSTFSLISDARRHREPDGNSVGETAEGERPRQNYLGGEGWLADTSINF